MEISRDSMPHLMKHLRTTCRASDCLGSIFAAIGEKFPDNFGIVEISPKQSPVVQFTNNRCFIDFQFEVNISVEPKSDETKCISLNVRHY